MNQIFIESRDEICQNLSLSSPGSNYRGTTSTTSSGRTCQNWQDQHPHRWLQFFGAFSYKFLKLLLNVIFSHDFDDTGDHNFCRNPDNGHRVWCYTTDPDMRWEFCDVPICDGNLKPDEIIIN